MQQFHVDDELAALVKRVANPKPSEYLSFNEALWRALKVLGATSITHEETNALDKSAESIGAALVNGPKKAPSPSVAVWVTSVPELRSRRGLTTWKAVCVHLNIDTGGDSARRRLKNWVKANRPSWPPVPDID